MILHGSARQSSIHDAASSGQAGLHMRIHAHSRIALQGVADSTRELCLRMMYDVHCASMAQKLPLVASEIKDLKMTARHAMSGTALYQVQMPGWAAHMHACMCMPSAFMRRRTSSSARPMTVAMSMHTFKLAFTKPAMSSWCAVPNACLVQALDVLALL